VRGDEKLFKDVHIFQVWGNWRSLYNEELRNLDGSPNIIRVIKSWRTLWAGQVARKREMRNIYKNLVGKPEAKR
jgi:hypothetical protein